MQRKYKMNIQLFASKRERELRQSITELSDKGDILFNLATRTDEQNNELQKITMELKKLNTELDSVVTLDGARTRISEQGTPVAQASRWNNPAEFFNAVKTAATHHRVDERLITNVAGNSVGVDSDGGFAVDSDFLPLLKDMIVEESVFFKDTSKITISGNANSLRIPLGARGYTTKNGAGTGEITAVAGGVAASWTPEGSKIAISKAKAGVLDIKLEKITVLTVGTEELVQDGKSFVDYMQQGAAKAIATVLDLAILNGDGVQQPIGIFSSKNANIVKVAPSDPTKPITIDDINKMHSALLPELREGAKWYVNPEQEGNLAGLSTANGSPVYLPAGTIASKPYGVLKGLPVEPTQKLSPTGNVGDILLGNMKEYQIIQKGSLQMDVSIHVYFDTAEQAFRFIMRVNGSPLYTEKYTSLGDNFALASFVTLDTRTTVKNQTERLKNKGRGKNDNNDIPPADESGEPR